MIHLCLSTNFLQSAFANFAHAFRIHCFVHQQSYRWQPEHHDHRRWNRPDHGLRTALTMGCDSLRRLTWGANTIDFFYDANGTPYALKYNGYYVTNLQGDVMRIVDASGTAVATYEYDPYGKVTTATGILAQTNPLRYCGYYYDNETGLYYLQSRYYDPALGRFIKTILGVLA